MKRVAAVSFYHETNTFALEQNTEPDAELHLGQEMAERAHPKSYVGGFLEGIRRDDIEVVPVAHIQFVHGGLVSAGMFEHYRDIIVDGLREAMPLDGVFFALHGAMAAGDPYTDAEGELLRAAREVAGEGVPFVATYDFHGIMTHDECAQLAAAFPNDTNPHIDNYERGLEAAGCLLRILDGEIQPVTRVVHVPIIGPNIGQSTWSHDADEEERLPLYQLNLIREAMEDTPGIVNLTIMGGYGYADTPESRMSVIATADGDSELAERMAGELAERVWQKRHDILSVRPIYSIDEGVRMAVESDEEQPVVLVDLGDDPGSATPSDSPAVLESLIRLGARDCVLTIRDPVVVDAAVAAGVGASLDIQIGASIDQRFYEPLPIRAQVKTIDDGKYMICGPTHGGWGREVNREAWREADAGLRVVLRLENKIDVIVTRERTRNDRDFMKSAGILFDEKKIIVVKSNQAHRASLRPVVSKIIELATPGASTVDYESLPFRHLQRPLWPIDQDFDWSSGR
ncbi:MAG: M81 family metallopeptidase [Thermomicrobiales bacterium]